MSKLTPTYEFAKTTLVVIVLLLLVIILISVGYIWLDNKRRKSNNDGQRLIGEKNNPESIDFFKDHESLAMEELPNEDIRITNHLGGFEIIVPVTYNLSGNGKHFSVAFYGTDNAKGPGPRDFSQLQFRIYELESPLLEKVKEEYRSMQENDGMAVNYGEIREVVVGSVNGYDFSCPFLVYGKCIYLPLKNSTKEYLFILKQYSDDNNRGYANALDKIISTFKYVN